jgi:hypothetical protein
MSNETPTLAFRLLSVIEVTASGWPGIVAAVLLVLIVVALLQVRRAP